VKPRRTRPPAPQDGAREIPLRITVVGPPEGVTFRVQRGRTNWDDPEFLAPAQSARDRISFDFAVRVGPRQTGRPPNFLGDFVQGPAGGRFVYVNSGKLAGQADSCWERRAKVPLAAITWQQIETVQSTSDAILEAHIHGTGRDGGPVCASVHLADGWKVMTTR
jgi:hypothetical protein